MKKFIIIFVLLILGAASYFLFFKEKKPTEIGENYKPKEVLQSNERAWGGVLPCVDCEGILVSLVLTDFDQDHESGEFTYSELYLGEEGGPYIKTGIWNKLGEEVIFDPKSDEFQNFSYRIVQTNNFLVSAELRVTPDLSQENYVLREEI